MDEELLEAFIMLVSFEIAMIVLMGLILILKKYTDTPNDETMRFIGTMFGIMTGIMLFLLVLISVNELLINWGIFG
jgi:hypothetical protein